jgi:hypothetical protein
MRKVADALRALTRVMRAITALAIAIQLLLMMFS